MKKGFKKAREINKLYGEGQEGKDLKWPDVIYFIKLLTSSSKSKDWFVLIDNLEKYNVKELIKEHRSEAEELTHH